MSINTKDSTSPVEPIIPKPPQPTKSVDAEGDLQSHVVKPAEKDEDMPSLTSLLSPATSEAPQSLKGRSKPETIDPEKKILQEVAIGKMQEAVKKLPGTSPPLDQQLQRGANEMQMRRHATQIANASDATSKNYALQGLGFISQNPVAKMGGAGFIPQGAITGKMNEKKTEGEEPINYKSVYANTRKLYNQASGAKEVKWGNEPLQSAHKDLQESVTLAFKEFHGFKGDKSNEEAVKESIIKLKASIEKIRDSYVLEYNDIIDLKQMSEGEKKKCELMHSFLDEFVSDLNARLSPLSLEGVTTYYSKDEALDQLRMKLELAPDSMNPSTAPAAESKQAIYAAIEAVKQSPEQYVKGSDIQNLSVELPKLTPYISSIEFITANNNSPMAASLIKASGQTAGLEGLEFIFKKSAPGTIDNDREILASQLLASLNLTKFLVPKQKTTLPGASLGKTENPEGITSPFIKGSVYASKEWDSLMANKMFLARTEFKIRKEISSSTEDFEKCTPEELGPKLESWGEAQIKSLERSLVKPEAKLEKFYQKKKELELEKLTTSKELMEAFNEEVEDNESDISMMLEDIQRTKDFIIETKSRKEELLNELKKNQSGYEQAKIDLMTVEGAVQSVRDHALTDTLLCSCDSHIVQYIVKDGDVLNIDFARFMAPSEAVIGDNNNVYLKLRSTFLDHPQASEPFSQDEIKTILSWNLAQIESDWTKDGLLGNETDFKKAEEEIKGLQAERATLGTDSDVILREKCIKYNLPKDLGADEMKKALQLELFKQESNLRKECYTKVHPEAFKAFKERALALQEYVKSNPSPSLKEAFPKMYPLAAPFMTVLERLDMNPSSSIGLINSEGSLQERSLNSIIAEAKEKSLASSREIQEMEEALAIYEQTSHPESSLKTAMDA